MSTAGASPPKWTARGPPGDRQGNPQDVRGGSPVHTIRGIARRFEHPYDPRRPASCDAATASFMNKIVNRASFPPSSVVPLQNGLLLLCWMILVLPSAGAHAQRVTHAYASDLKTVRALLEQPESQMDLADIKLTIDQMIDPAIDKAAVLKQLDEMA